jgi:hypothetical protein
MLPGDDVLEVMREAAVFLAKQAVFATICSTLSDEGSRNRVHQQEPFAPK